MQVRLKGWNRRIYCIYIDKGLGWGQILLAERWGNWLDWGSWWFGSGTRRVNLNLTCWRKGNYHFEKTIGSVPHQIISNLFWNFILCNNIGFTIWIWLVFDILSCGVKNFGFGAFIGVCRTLKRGSRYFARQFRALVMSEGDFMTLSSIPYFEVIEAIYSCLEFCVVNT